MGPPRAGSVSLLEVTQRHDLSVPACELAGRGPPPASQEEAPTGTRPCRHLPDQAPGLQTRGRYMPAVAAAWSVTATAPVDGRNPGEAAPAPPPVPVQSPGSHTSGDFSPPVAGVRTWASGPGGGAGGEGPAGQPTAGWGPRTLLCSHHEDSGGGVSPVLEPGACPPHPRAPRGTAFQGVQRASLASLTPARTQLQTVPEISAAP